jgi:thiamine pyrophosphate-dependent acetolactate synthase large subunit-like protein
LDSGRLEVDRFPAPQQVESQASMLQKGNNWIISASGGVKISAWSATQKAEESETLSAPRTKAAPTPAGNWWWN